MKNVWTDSQGMIQSPAPSSSLWCFSRPVLRCALVSAVSISLPIEVPRVVFCTRYFKSPSYSMESRKFEACTLVNVTDTQLLTLALAVILPLSLLIYSNSRITDAKETLRAEMVAGFTQLRADFNERFNSIDRNLEKTLRRGADPQPRLRSVNAP